MSDVPYVDALDPSALPAADRQQLIDELYEVQTEVFDGVSRDSFAAYVVESTAQQSWLHVYRDPGDKRAVGYTALHRFDRSHDGKPASFFRAEAGVLRPYRGRVPMGSLPFREVSKHILANPFGSTWFLACPVHPSSYHGVARVCRELWPRAGVETPPQLQAQMAAFGDEFHLPQVGADPLVRQVGWITRDTEVDRRYWRTCQKPAARYFVERNPSYGEGHGLIMLIRADVGSAIGVATRVAGLRLRRMRQRSRWAWLRGRPPTRAEIRERLASSAVFSSLSDDTLDQVAAQVQLRRFAAGEGVVRAGQPDDAMYLIASGAAYVLRPGPEPEDERLLDNLGTGEIFGEMALLTGQARTADVRAASSLDVLVIQADALDALIEADAAVGDAVWQAFDLRRLDNAMRGDARFAEWTWEDRRAWGRAGQLVHHHADTHPIALPAGWHLVSAGAIVHQGRTVPSPAVVHNDVATDATAEPGARVLSLPAPPRP